MGAGCCICCMLSFYLVASLALSGLLFQPVRLPGKVGYTACKTPAALPNVVLLSMMTVMLEQSSSTKLENLIVLHWSKVPCNCDDFHRFCTDTLLYSRLLCKLYFFPISLYSVFRTFKESHWIITCYSQVFSYELKCDWYLRTMECIYYTSWLSYR